MTSLLGLFGEVFLMYRSADLAPLARAWRADDSSRFDFSADTIRLEVKTSGTRQRSHDFSYDQCNSSPETVAIVASMFGEVVNGGTSLRQMLEDIGDRLASDPELVRRVYATVARTAGSALHDALNACFDLELASETVEFFDLKLVPAIRGPLPPHVNHVRFQADLSGATPLAVADLPGLDPRLLELLARNDRITESTPRPPDR